MYLLSRFIYWFLHPRPGGENQVALIAISSVAAVIWTGGIIAITIKRPDYKLISGNDLLGFAAFAPLAALIGSGVPLRILLLVFGLFYFFVAVRYIRIAGKLRQFADKGIKHWKGVSVATGAMAVRNYGLIMLTSLVAYFLPVIWPTQTCVAWCAGTMLFLGYQFLLSTLYVTPDKGTPT